MSDSENSTAISNGIHYSCCKSCVIAEAKKLEDKNALLEAILLLQDAEIQCIEMANSYTATAHELKARKKALYSRLNDDERDQVAKIQSSKKFSKNSSMMKNCHPPLNFMRRKQEVRLPERNPNDEFFCPIAVFEHESDPRQKPMYLKHLVYKDGRDVQLEEIRAATYWERLKKEAKEKHTSKILPENNEDKENVLPTCMIPPPWDENEEDNTCDTKAFAMILPSSTPNKRRSQFYSNGIFAEPRCSTGPRTSIASTTVNLSMIPETSRERSSSSSGAGSVASVANSKNSVPDKPALSSIAETEEKSNTLHSSFDISDPFSPVLRENLLEKLEFPNQHHRNGYHPSKTDTLTIKLSNSYKLGSIKYTIAAEIGKGSYARIVKASPANQPRKLVALKIQKPACVWEYYISKEILNRLESEEKLQYFLHYSDIFVFRDCSILLSELAPYGSLLNFKNEWKTVYSNSQDKYPMAVGVYLSIQIISAVNYLHSCKIIHGDIKPDNFVISTVSSDGRPTIKLIDFGRSIDMTLFSNNTVFHKVIKTHDFTCNEMRDGKAWTYQTDLFGMAGTFYVLLIGDYMKTIKKNDGLWVLQKSIARYMCRDQWDPIFMALLNVPSCNELPDLAVLKVRLETFYDSFNSFDKKQQFNKMLPIFRNLKQQSV